MSEGLLTVAVTVMGYEYNRQNNYQEAAARRTDENAAARRADVEARLERLEALLAELKPPPETKRMRWWS